MSISTVHADRANGFGLIELLVAMAIGLLLMGATLTLYLDLSRSNQEMARVNQQIEAGAIAMQLLREDIQHAGFWNGYVPEFDDFTFTGTPSDYPSAVPDPCLPFASWNATEKANRVGMALQVFADVPAGCSSQLPDKVAGSDVLVVRYAQGCVAGTANCDPLTAGEVYFQASQCEGEARYALESYVDAGNPAPLTQRDCTTVAERRKWVNNIYYLRSYANTAGDGIPTLMRSEFLAGVQQAAVPLIEGVEAMRFELGSDQVSDAGLAVNFAQAVNWADENNRTSPTNRGDGAVDVLCLTNTPCGLDDQVNAVLVKPYLLVRTLQETTGYSSDKTYYVGDPGDSDAEYGPFADSFKRHVYSTSIRLTNVSARRETP